jgi:transcriptional regulator
MYLPTVFAETDTARLHDLLDAHSFGVMIVATEGGLEIAHLPFVLDRTGGLGRLRVHTARANPIWRAALDARQVTVVFAGPHGYVSPRWYERPREMVPTWNYVAVHAHGRAEGPLPDHDLAALVAELAERHEAGAPEPWRYADLEPAQREKLLPQIVGLSIEIERLEGKLKLSQNRSDADRARVRAALLARGGADDVAMAALMKA